MCAAAPAGCPSPAWEHRILWVHLKLSSMEDLSTQRENRRAFLPGSILEDTGGTISWRYKEGMQATARRRLGQMYGSVYVTFTCLILLTRHIESRLQITSRCTGYKGRRISKAQSSKLNEKQQIPQYGTGLGLRITCVPKTSHRSHVDNTLCQVRSREHLPDYESTEISLSSVRGQVDILGTEFIPKTTRVQVKPGSRAWVLTIQKLGSYLIAQMCTWECYLCRHMHMYTPTCLSTFTKQDMQI